MKVLAITGYKPHELQVFKNNDPAVHYIKKAIQRQLESLLDEHSQLEWIVISGQQGVELWAAEVVFALQVSFSQLKLAVLTPYLDQQEKWKDQNKEYYQSILSQANYVDSISKKQYESPLQLKMKNQFIVDKSDGILMVYEEESPGSPKYILEAARQKAGQSDYSIYMIDSYELQVIVEESQLNEFQDW